MKYLIPLYKLFKETFLNQQEDITRSSIPIVREKDLEESEGS